MSIVHFIIPQKELGKRVRENCTAGVFFKPEEILIHGESNSKCYSVLVLNRPILHHKEFLVPFWNKAALRLTVDGGTNRWFNYLKKKLVAEKDVLPVDIVTGDLDSITQESLARVKEQGAEVIHTPDQDETDFTKALIELSQQSIKRNINLDAVFVIYQCSGRIDQTFSNFNTIYKCLHQRILKDMPIFLLSEDSLSWLLKQGQTAISIPETLKTSKNAWCGLIPMGEKCESISTFGLKWNLEGHSLEFGKIVSTSNRFDESAKIVTIQSSSPLIWCMGIRPLFSHWFNVQDEED